MNINKKIIKRIIFGILLLLWMGVIFYMSSRTAEESSKTSQGITKLVSDIAVQTGILEKDDLTGDLISEIHKWIRVFAHYFEYMILGILSLSFFLQFKYKKLIKVAAGALIFCIIYAISDEIHQYFVPGRTMDIMDVLTDTLGSITGILIIYIIYIKEKINGKSENI